MLSLKFLFSNQNTNRVKTGQLARKHPNNCKIELGYNGQCINGRLYGLAHVDAVGEELKFYGAHVAYYLAVWVVDSKTEEGHPHFACERVNDGNDHNKCN